MSRKDKVLKMIRLLDDALGVYTSLAEMGVNSMKATKDLLEVLMDGEESEVATLTKKTFNRECQRMAEAVISLMEFDEEV